LQVIFLNSNYKLES